MPWSDPWWYIDSEAFIVELTCDSGLTCDSEAIFQSTHCHLQIFQRDWNNYNPCLLFVFKFNLNASDLPLIDQLVTNEIKFLNSLSQIATNAWVSKVYIPVPVKRNRWFDLNMYIVDETRISKINSTKRSSIHPRFYTRLS